MQILIQKLSKLCECTYEEWRCTQHITAEGALKIVSE